MVISLCSIGGDRIYVDQVDSLTFEGFRLSHVQKASEFSGKKSVWVGASLLIS